jgi:hypothetical protein
MLASLLSLHAAAPAAARPAHVAPRLRIASPDDGARVFGTTLRVVVVGEGGDGPGLFSLALDGVLVDTTGKVGGTFTTLSVRPNEQTVINVPITAGDHELRLAQASDPDNTGAGQPPVVHRITVEKDSGGNAWMLGVAALVVACAAGVLVAVRRRAAESRAGVQGVQGD